MTDINADELDVIHNAKESRFEVTIDGKTAQVAYMQAGKNVIFPHTEVPIEFEGQGIASKIAKTALDWAVDNGYKIQALCPFISAYIKRHAEYQPHTWGY